MNSNTENNGPGTGNLVAFRDFIDMIRVSDPMRYQTKFSLDPFLDKYTHHVQDGCPLAAAHMMPKVEEVKTVCHDSHFLDEASPEEMDRQMGSMFSLFMPSLVFDDSIVGIHSPFSPDFKYSSPGLKVFIDDENWQMDMDLIYKGSGEGFNTIKCCAHILNKLYGQNIDIMSNVIFCIRNKETELERHFRMVPNHEYIKINVEGALPELTQKDIQHLLRNMDNADVWLEMLPPEVFSFEGMMIGTLVDVTESEVVYKMKSMVSGLKEDIKASDYNIEVKKEVRNFLNDSEVDFGFVGLAFKEYFKKARFSLTKKSNGKIVSEIKSANSGLYKEAINSRKPVVVEDLTELESPNKLERSLLENNIKSIIVYPVFGEDGKLITILEMGSSKANGLNALTLMKLQPMLNALIDNNNLFLDEMANRTNQFIQNQFTSIHPSVEWKFEEVAEKFQIESTLDEFSGDIDPIVFKDVFPIYGQADIVGSSAKRNAGIQADLLDNLFRVRALIKAWTDVKDIHILKSYFNRVNKLYTRIEKNFVTSDESTVVDLLTREVHPFLHQLSERFEDLPQEIYNEYFDYLDPDLGIVYIERKKYERSVGKLNQTISDYIEQDDAELQKILPHYFEKYKTDGIEYNMYVGQSITPDIEFGTYYLKEFKLRQLVQLCEVTKLVERLSPTLDVPLSTAQLIFAYNHTLSIRFRMDEKQFDVDGAYNVRYEILKKRIDKAVVKGTKERLTLAGKISIVYLQDTDRREYIEYINYLIEQNLIEKDYEVLELEKLQGAEGLKALRLTVKKDNTLENQIKEIEARELV